MSRSILIVDGAYEGRIQWVEGYNFYVSKPRSFSLLNKPEMLLDKPDTEIEYRVERLVLNYRSRHRFIVKQVFFEFATCGEADLKPEFLRKLINENENEIKYDYISFKPDFVFSHHRWFIWSRMKHDPDWSFAREEAGSVGVDVEEIRFVE